MNFILNAVLFAAFFAAFVLAQYERYRSHFDIDVGETEYIQPLNYPLNYTKGSVYVWRAHSPPNTHCVLRCMQILMPISPDCVNDRLLVSETGDPEFRDAIKHCGHQNTFEIVSESNEISISLIASPYSETGNFYCTLTAENDCLTKRTESGGSVTKNQCGWKKQLRIVGGEPTEVNEFPMMVAFYDKVPNLIYCGGVIVHPRWILTAAHCFETRKPELVNIVCGDYSMKIEHDSPATVTMQPEKFIMHPKYTGGYDYDIGLARTNQEIIYSSLVGPACLPFKFRGKSLAGIKVEAAGWGRNMSRGYQPENLQKVKLSVVGREECANKVGNMVSDFVLCTYAEGKDTCQRDSGGPILYQDTSNGKWYHVGIVLGGIGCATSLPSLNSKVFNDVYLQWIQDTINDYLPNP